VARAYYNSDIAALNSGGIRIDQLLAAGPLKFSVVNNMIDDWVIEKLVRGDKVLEMLEVSCSKYPSYDGRFLMTSGLRYTFDAAKPPMSRVVKESVVVNGSPLDLKREYRVALRDYSAKGGDGFTCLKDCPYTVNPETGVTMIFLFTRFYKPMQVPHNADLSSLPSLSKRRSSKTDRMSKFIVGMKEIDDMYYVEISP
jgi:5'-nucleotidase